MFQFLTIINLLCDQISHFWPVEVYASLFPNPFDMTPIDIDISPELVHTTNEIILQKIKPESDQATKYIYQFKENTGNGGNV